MMLMIDAVKMSALNILDEYHLRVESLGLLRRLALLLN
jgi:hypothetical protein